MDFQKYKSFNAMVWVAIILINIQGESQFFITQVHCCLRYISEIELKFQKYNEGKNVPIKNLKF